MSAYHELFRAELESLESSIEDAFQMLIMQGFKMPHACVATRLIIDGTYIFNLEVFYLKDEQKFLGIMNMRPRTKYSTSKIIGAAKRYQDMLGHAFTITTLHPSALYDAALAHSLQVQAEKRSLA